MQKSMKKFLTTPHLFSKTINAVIAKIRRRGDLKRDNLDYIIIKNSKFARFYLRPKIHKRLHNVPSRPVIFNSGKYTKNISSFLDHHLQSLAQAVKSYIKGTNEFLKKLHSYKSYLVALFYVIWMLQDILEKDI